MSKNISEKFSPEKRQELAARIKTLRHNASLDQAELASLAGIARGTLSSIENSRTVPQTAVLVRVYEALGIALTDPTFDEPTNQALAAIGALIEAIPEHRRADAVSTVIISLSRAVRDTSTPGPTPPRKTHQDYLSTMSILEDIKSSQNDIDHQGNTLRE